MILQDHAATYPAVHRSRQPQSTTQSKLTFRLGVTREWLHEHFPRVEHGLYGTQETPQKGAAMRQKPDWGAATIELRTHPAAPTVGARLVGGKVTHLWFTVVQDAVELTLPIGGGAIEDQELAWLKRNLAETVFLTLKETHPPLDFGETGTRPKASPRRPGTGRQTSGTAGAGRRSRRTGAR